MLIEILPVLSVVNGTAVTVVTLDQLLKEHRRHKRDIDKETIRFRKSHQAENKISVRDCKIMKEVPHSGREINTDCLVFTYSLTK